MSSFRVIPSDSRNREAFDVLDFEPLPLGRERSPEPAFQRDDRPEEISNGAPWGSMGSKRREAEDILEQARRRAQEIEKEAYEKAFALGEKAGMEIAKRQFHFALSSLEQAQREFKGRMERVCKGSEEALIRLCLAVCRTVIAQEVEGNRSVVVKAIESGIRRILDASWVKIRVHPADLDHLLRYREELLASEKGIKDLSFEADPHVGKGGAVLETRFGEVDCRIERKLDEIERRFTSILEEGRKEA